jgi:hypothetical protein
MTVKLEGLRIVMPASNGKATFRVLKPFAPDVPLEPSKALRRRIWELNASFHCSIVGTCFTTVELRQLLVGKMKLPGAQKDDDHQLHGRAVLIAAQRTPEAKLLQKALDRRHRTAISKFEKTSSASDLARLWTEAVERAEIPGAYWALLTHPEATEDLVRRAFGEVHMLSHLVGAANRADIRRLRQLESENGGLQDKVARQQTRLRDSLVERDATVARLNEALGRALASSSASKDCQHHDAVTATDLVADLRQRLATELAARERAERRCSELKASRDAERLQRERHELRERQLEREIEAAELSLSRLLPRAIAEREEAEDLKGVTLLYVGGRAHQVPQLRRLVEERGGLLLHHDGGIDDRSGLLEAQVASADVTVFPVDCVSHNAVSVVKRVARSAGKPFVPLRSTGLSSFVAALGVSRDSDAASCGASPA